MNLGRRLRCRALTLIELLCVVAIIGILLGLYTGAIQRGYRYCVNTIEKVIKESPTITSSQ
jgi:prepilin-type N-terminal cleavage/methylation domain-containing protein